MFCSFRFWAWRSYHILFQRFVLTIVRRVVYRMRRIALSVKLFSTHCLFPWLESVLAPNSSHFFGCWYSMFCGNLALWLATGRKLPILRMLKAFQTYSGSGETVGIVSSWFCSFNPKKSLAKHLSSCVVCSSLRTWRFIHRHQNWRSAPWHLNVCVSTSKASNVKCSRQLCEQFFSRHDRLSIHKDRKIGCNPPRGGKVGKTIRIKISATFSSSTFVVTLLLQSCYDALLLKWKSPKTFFNLTLKIGLWEA